MRSQDRMFDAEHHLAQTDCEPDTMIPLNNRVRAALPRDEYERLSAGVELSFLPSGKQIVGDLLRSLIDLRSDLLPRRSRLLIRAPQQSKSVSHKVAHTGDLFVDKPVILSEPEALGQLNERDLPARLR